ncbi:MAG: phytoene desaturase [Deltaproteobacteria bacterium]|nr:phytoene desaturase [Deltaproteobacteria bacterium]
MKRHVIIVGAGPGGLSAAINLAGQGFRVTVLEKEAIPGGRMRGLTLGERGEYQVDTGPSIMQLPGVLESIFTRAGKRLQDYAPIVPVDPNTRIHFWDGTHLDTRRGDAEMEAEVHKLAPGKDKAYRAWMKESREKYGVAYERFMATPADSLGYYAPWRLLPAVKFKPWQSLYSHLDGYFGDDRLSYAFSYPSKYLGLHPTNCSSVFSVIPFLELEFGVWHVVGGFRQLARGMMKCAQDLGATFRMSTPVERVWVEGGRVRGVELPGGERLPADAVVVNADLPYAASNLIDERWREGTRLSDRALDRAKYSCSTFMLYLGLDKVYRELPHHLIYLSNAARRTDKAALEDHAADLEDPPFYVVNPTPTDPAGAPEGHSTLYVLVPTPNTHRDVDWKHVEAELTRKVPQWLAKVGMKDVASHIRAQKAFTAETWRDDFNVGRGAVFNLSHTWLQLGPLRPKVKSPDIQGLFWVGGGTHPGSGLLTIMESANIAAHHLCQQEGMDGLPTWPHVPALGSLPDMGQPRASSAA